MQSLFISVRDRFLRVTAMSGLIAACLVFSSCVSSVDDLTDSASLAPEGGQSLETELNSDIPSADLQSQVAFVPTKAPRSAGVVQQLAEVADDTQVVATTKTTDIKFADPENEASNADKPIDGNTQVGSVSKSRVEPTSSTNAKKPTLLQRLLQARADKRAQEKQRESFKKARKSARPKIVARTRNFKRSSLPGVKKNSKLFGLDDQTDRDNVQVASVGGFGRLSPNGLRVQHAKVNVGCLKPELLKILKIVERKYRQKPIVTSGYRSPKRNRRAGGASNSQHIYCKAADIQLDGVSKWDLAKFLRSIRGRGGVGTYCRTKSVHIDVGPKRDWHHPCRRSVLRRKRKA